MHLGHPPSGAGLCELDIDGPTIGTPPYRHVGRPLKDLEEAGRRCLRCSCEAHRPGVYGIAGVGQVTGDTEYSVDVQAHHVASIFAEGLLPSSVGFEFSTESLYILGIGIPRLRHDQGEVRRENSIARHGVDVVTLDTIDPGVQGIRDAYPLNWLAERRRPRAARQ